MPSAWQRECTPSRGPGPPLRGRSSCMADVVGMCVGFGGRRGGLGGGGGGGAVCVGPLRVDHNRQLAWCRPCCGSFVIPRHPYNSAGVRYNPECFYMFPSQKDFFQKCEIFLSETYFSESTYQVHLFSKSNWVFLLSQNIVFFCIQFSFGLLNLFC